jgi:hypothetical protein
MKRSEALALQEGDLVDVSAPGWQGGRAYGRKVLIVSSKGGVFVTRSIWEAGGRWVQFHHVVALGQREELTEKERANQIYEVERFQARRERLRQKTLRKRTPQALYAFVWDELEGGEGRSLEVLQAKAGTRGLQADTTTWDRIGRILGCSRDPQVWRMPLGKRNTSVLVMPRLPPQHEYLGVAGGGGL